MDKKIWFFILLSALVLALAYPYIVFAQSQIGRDIIQKAIEASKAAHGYEVEIERQKSRLAHKASLHELGTLPGSTIRSQGQVKKSVRLKVDRDPEGRIRYHRLPSPNPPRPASSAKASPSPASSQGVDQEAIFTIDPEDLFHRIDHATVTELSRSDTELVLKIEMPPGAAPAPDWPEMWLKATFDRERDLLLKSELIVEGEPRIISEFDYRLVANRHWLPDRKNIRIVEKDGVTLIDDTYGVYR